MRSTKQIAQEGAAAVSLQHSALMTVVAKANVTGHEPLTKQEVIALALAKDRGDLDRPELKMHDYQYRYAVQRALMSDA